jgi:hypothetical protein
VDISVVNEATTQKYTAWVVPSSEILSKLPTTKGYIMLELSKTKLKIIAYRLRDAEKILNSMQQQIFDIRMKEVELIVKQANQDLLNILEGNDLRDVEKEIERLQRSLTN